MDLRNILKSIFSQLFIRTNKDKQFVLVNYNNDLSSMFEDLPNLSSDTAEAVKELLK